MPPVRRGEHHRRAHRALLLRGGEPPLLASARAGACASPRSRCGRTRARSRSTGRTRRAAGERAARARSSARAPAASSVRAPGRRPPPRARGGRSRCSLEGRGGRARAPARAPPCRCGCGGERGADLDDARHAPRRGRRWSRCILTSAASTCRSRPASRGRSDSSSSSACSGRASAKYAPDRPGAVRDLRRGHALDVRRGGLRARRRRECGHGTRGGARRRPRGSRCVPVWSEHVLPQRGRRPSAFPAYPALVPALVLARRPSPRRGRRDACATRRTASSSGRRWPRSIALVVPILAASGDRRAVLDPLAERLVAVEAGREAGGPFAGLSAEGGTRRRAGGRARGAPAWGGGAGRCPRGGTDPRRRRRLAGSWRSPARSTRTRRGSSRLARSTGPARCAPRRRRRARGRDLRRDDGPRSARRRGARGRERRGVGAARGARRAGAPLAAATCRSIPSAPTPARRPSRSCVAIEALHDLAARREIEVVLGRLEGDGRSPLPAALLAAFGGGRAPGLPRAAAASSRSPRAGEEGEADAAARTIARAAWRAGFAPEEVAVVAAAPRRAAAPARARARGARRAVLVGARPGPRRSPAGAGRARRARRRRGARPRDRRAARRVDLPRARRARRAARRAARSRRRDRRSRGAASRPSVVAPRRSGLRQRRASGRALERAAAGWRRSSCCVRPLSAPATPREHARRLGGFLDAAGVRRRAARGATRARRPRPRRAAGARGGRRRARSRARARGARRRAARRAAAWGALLGVAVEGGGASGAARARRGRGGALGARRRAGAVGARRRHRRVRRGRVPAVRGAGPAAPATWSGSPSRGRSGAPALPTAAARRAEALHRAFCAAAAGREAVAFVWPAPGPSGRGAALAPLVADALAAIGVGRPSRARSRAVARGGAHRDARRSAPSPGSARPAPRRSRGRRSRRARRPRSMPARSRRRAARRSARAAPRRTRGGSPERRPARSARRCPPSGRRRSSRRTRAARSASSSSWGRACPDPAAGDLDQDAARRGKPPARGARAVRLRAARAARVAARGRRVDVAEAHAAAEAVFARFEAEGRTGDPAVWAARREAVLSRIARVVQAEARDHDGLAPALLEHRFGGRSAKPPLVVHADGDTVRLQGRIDRVDASGERLLVIDYKNARDAKAYAELLEPDAMGVTSFQVPAYLLAAARDLPGRASLEAAYALLRKAVRTEPFATEPGDPLLALEPPPQARAGDGGAAGMSDGPRGFAMGVVDVVRRIRAGEFPIAPARVRGLPVRRGVPRREERRRRGRRGRRAVTVPGRIVFGPAATALFQLDAPTAVSAGAGSGKTTALVELCARLLSGEALGTPCAPAEIAAITFTEKAAEELAQRPARRRRGARSGGAGRRRGLRGGAGVARAAPRARPARRRDHPRLLRAAPARARAGGGARPRVRGRSTRSAPRRGSARRRAPRPSRRSTRARPAARSLAAGLGASRRARRARRRGRGARPRARDARRRRAHRRPRRPGRSDAEAARARLLAAADAIALAGAAGGERGRARPRRGGRAARSTRSLPATGAAPIDAAALGRLAALGAAAKGKRLGKARRLRCASSRTRSPPPRRRSRRSPPRCSRAPRRRSSCRLVADAEARYAATKRAARAVDFDDLLVLARDLLRARRGAPRASCAGALPRAARRRVPGRERRAAGAVRAARRAGRARRARCSSRSAISSSRSTASAARTSPCSRGSSAGSAAGEGRVLHLSDNHRSAPAVVDLVNEVFARCMRPPDGAPPRDDEIRFSGEDRLVPRRPEGARPACELLEDGGEGNAAERQARARRQRSRGASRRIVAGRAGVAVRERGEGGAERARRPRLARRRDPVPPPHADRRVRAGAARRGDPVPARARRRLLPGAGGARSRRAPRDAADPGRRDRLGRRCSDRRCAASRTATLYLLSRAGLGRLARIPAEGLADEMTRALCTGGADEAAPVERGAGRRGGAGGRVGAARPPRRGLARAPRRCATGSRPTTLLGRAVERLDLDAALLAGPDGERRAANVAKAIALAARFGADGGTARRARAPPARAWRRDRRASRRRSSRPATRWRSSRCTRRRGSSGRWCSCPTSARGRATTGAARSSTPAGRVVRDALRRRARRRFVETASIREARERRAARRRRGVAPAPLRRA